MSDNDYRIGLLREFFFTRLSELGERQRQLELAIRTKKPDTAM